LKIHNVFHTLEDTTCDSEILKFRTLNTHENIYDLLNEYLDIGDNGINILEEQIDSETQLEYFEFSRNYENKRGVEDIFLYKDEIFDNEISIDRKKKILVQLATVNDVEAYRTIEKYLRKPGNRLYEWAYMALQESRLLIESQLLEESKILITTGLGGKGLKLRYFIVFFTIDGRVMTKLQKKIIRSELNYTLKRKGAEIEDIIFKDGFACVLSMVPMQIPVQKLFNKILYECNQFGDFLFNDFIITNVKVLSLDEIKELLAINNLL
jgi:hypothetical protein